MSPPVVCAVSVSRSAQIDMHVGGRPCLGTPRGLHILWHADAAAEEVKCSRAELAAVGSVVLFVGAEQLVDALAGLEDHASVGARVAEELLPDADDLTPILIDGLLGKYERSGRMVG